MEQLIFLWKYHPGDFKVAIINFVITLVTGVQFSIYLALALSLYQVLISASNSRIVCLGVLVKSSNPENHKRNSFSLTPNKLSPRQSPRTAPAQIFNFEPSDPRLIIKFHDIKVYPEGILIPGLLMVRLDQSLTSYNVGSLADLVLLHTNINEVYLKSLKYFETDHINPNFSIHQPYHTLLIDCDRMLSLDATSLFRFEDLVYELSLKDIKLCFANIRKGVLKSLTVTKIKPQDRKIYTSMENAIMDILKVQNKKELVEYLMQIYNAKNQECHLSFIQDLKED